MKLKFLLLMKRVKVAGNVLLTSEIPYSKGRGFNYYLNAVGGLDAKGWRKKLILFIQTDKQQYLIRFIVF